MPLPVHTYPAVSPIYSFAALKSKQREVKDRGAKEVVHITENGNAAYIFCSEEVFAQEKANAIEDALYEERLKALLERSQVDLAAGRVYHGIEAAKLEVEKRLKSGQH